MKIKEFIQKEILLPQVKQRGVLVVYDPVHRYHDLCLELASENLCVIDASQSSITSRAAALAALQEFGRPNPQLEGILVYVPGKPPLTDEEKQREEQAVGDPHGHMRPIDEQERHRGRNSGKHHQPATRNGPQDIFFKRSRALRLHSEGGRVNCARQTRSFLLGHH